MHTKGIVRSIFIRHMLSVVSGQQDQVGGRQVVYVRGAPSRLSVASGATIHPAEVHARRKRVLLGDHPLSNPGDSPNSGMGQALPNFCWRASWGAKKNGQQIFVS